MCGNDLLGVRLVHPDSGATLLNYKIPIARIIATPRTKIEMLNLFYYFIFPHYFFLYLLRLLDCIKINVALMQF